MLWWKEQFSSLLQIATYSLILILFERGSTSHLEFGWASDFFDHYSMVRLPREVLKKRGTFHTSLEILPLGKANFHVSNLTIVTAAISERSHDQSSWVRQRPVSGQGPDSHTMPTLASILWMRSAVRSPQPQPPFDDGLIRDPNPHQPSWSKLVVRN